MARKKVLNIFCILLVFITASCTSQELALDGYKKIVSKICSTALQKQNELFSKIPASNDEVIKNYVELQDSIQTATDNIKDLVVTEELSNKQKKLVELQESYNEQVGITVEEIKTAQGDINIAKKSATYNDAVNQILSLRTQIDAIYKETNIKCK